MSEIVNLHAAKPHLSRLVDRVAAGEEILIARHGRPVARLAPILPASIPRVQGAWRGKIRIAPDFDEPVPVDLAEEFLDSNQNLKLD